MRKKLFFLRTFTPLLLGAVLLFSGCVANKQARLDQERREAFDLLTEGQQLKEQGDYLLARDTFLRSAELSERPVVYYEIASCYEKLGDWEKAELYYEKTMELEDNYPAAQAALQLIQQQHPMEERTTSAPAAQTDGDHSKAGKKVRTERKKPQSEGLFDGVTETFGGKTESTGKDVPPADPAGVRSALFPELAEDSSVAVDQLVVKAQEAEKFGRLDEAIRLWERVLEADPEDAGARVSLAKALGKTGRLQRAEQEFEQAIAVAPEDSENIFALGNYYAENADFKKAASNYARVLELEPDHVRAKNNLGVIHLRLGNTQLAEEKFNELTVSHPEFSQGWLNLALAREKNGCDDKEILAALEFYQRLEPETDEETARWLRELLRKGE